MKYRVIDKITKKDITNDYKWVVTPDGKLYRMEYCDFIGMPNAMYIPEAGMLELQETTQALNKLKDAPEVVHFELNNWFSGTDYPDDEPFMAWIHDTHLYLRNEEWVKQNGLCVVFCQVDMSENFCVTAPKDWVMKACPKLLTEYRRFLREPDEDGVVYGKFEHEFLEYTPENIGIKETKEWQ